MAFFLSKKSQLQKYAKKIPSHYRVTDIHDWELSFDFRYCQVTETGFVVGPHADQSWENTPWCRCEFVQGGPDFQTDPMGMFPLWEKSESGQFSGFLQFFVQDHQYDLSDDFIYREKFFSPVKGIRRVLNSGSPIDFYPDNQFKTVGEAVEELESTIIESFSNVRKVEQLTVFLSGGLDSSIAASLGQTFRKGARLNTLTLGSDLGDEFTPAKELAEILQSAHRECQFDREEAKALLQEVVELNQVFDGLTAEILIQILFLIKAVPEGQVVLTGYGSDLLYWGDVGA